ncbi:MAG: RluA family pseudouridine synthase [Pseudomonadota bacterium]
MSKVAMITVGADEAEQRVDRWFRRRYPHIGQGRIEKMCRKGEIRVDGGRVKASSRINPGQVVRVPPLPDEAAVAPMTGESRSEVPDEARERILRAVVHRDEHILVLNKPAGLAVQGGTGQSLHLGALLPTLRFDRDDDPRLVHRLDRDTSGVLVLARTGRAAERLGRQFAGRDVTKLYFAAVAGRPEPSAGTIRYGLVKSRRSGAERVETVHPGAVSDTDGARHAVTDYRVIEQAGSRAAWVALWPRTGRTHQLRAHMAALGCPIAGDGKYGGRGQTNEGDGWGAGLGGGISRKLHLHAARLTLSHPSDGRNVTYRADLPEHMERTWEMFGWRFEDVPEDMLVPE